MPQEDALVKRDSLVDSGDRVNRLPRPRRVKRALALLAVFAAGWGSHARLVGAPAVPQPSTARNYPPVTLHFLNQPDKNDRRPLFSPEECPLTVLFTDDEFVADCLIIDSDTHSAERLVPREEQRRVRPWQTQAILAYESAPNRPALEEHHQLIKEGRGDETYEIEMSYRLNSDVPQVYAYSYMDFERDALPWELKRQDRLASAFMSNCDAKNARSLILDELIRLLPGQVDSFGDCSRNADVIDELRQLKLLDTIKEPSLWNVKVAATAAYKFSFAMENSNERDYVTEKYFQCMEHGSVPLVLGAPNFAQDFLPSPDAAINIANYLPPSHSALSTTNTSAPTELCAEAKAGLARLAKRLKHLGSEAGRGEYESALQWKKSDKWRGTPFGRVVELGRQRFSAECRLAGLVRGEQWAKSLWAPGGSAI